MAEHQTSTTRKTQAVPITGATAKTATAPEKSPVITLDKPLDAKQILHLQRTIGNRAVQRLLKQQHQAQPAELRRRKTMAQRRKQPHEIETENNSDNELVLAPDEAQQRETAPDMHTSEVPRVQRTTETHSSKTPTPDISASLLPALHRLETQPQPQANGLVLQRAITPAKVFKKIGIGVANLAGESVLGPIVDLKHAIRMIWEHKDKKKVDKVKDRVKEEWIGDYKGHTWMKVIHAITTAVEKVGALAGAIALIATIASAWFGAAAPIAAVAAIIGVSCAGLAFILRSILTVASFAYKDVDKKTAITNLVGVLGNMLGIISFGVGVKLAGGISFESEVSKTVGRDIGAGIAFSVGTKVSSVVTDIAQSKRAIQREGDSDEEKAKQNPVLIDIANVLTEVEEVLPAEKKDAAQDKQAILTDQPKYASVGNKFGEMLGQNEDLKSKANEMQSSQQQLEDAEEQPDEESANEVSEHDVNQLESDLNQGEQYIDSETAPPLSMSQVPEKKKKRGFFGKIKDKVKSGGKSIKKTLSKLAMRAKSVFNRFKVFMKKLQLKIAGFVLKALGLDKDMQAAKQEFELDANSQDRKMQEVDVREQKVQEADTMLNGFK